MRKKLPVLLDRPETQVVGVTAIYSVICFFSLPFILLLTLGGFEDNIVVISWLEIIFHVLNFVVMVGLFKDYLYEAMDNLRIHKKEVIRTILIAMGLMLVVMEVWFALLQRTGSDVFFIASFGTVPMSEMDMFSLSADVVCANPIFGTLCMVVLTPVTVSCIYYAVGFVPAYNVRPWLGYLVVAAVIAFPRICNAATYWDPAQQLISYLTHLPIQMIACWAYRRTDTIWTPIILHAATNLVACVVLILMYAI